MKIALPNNCIYLQFQFPSLFPPAKTASSSLVEPCGDPGPVATCGVFAITTKKLTLLTGPLLAHHAAMLVWTEAPQTPVAAIGATALQKGGKLVPKQWDDNGRWSDICFLHKTNKLNRQANKQKTPVIQDPSCYMAVGAENHPTYYVN